MKEFLEAIEKNEELKAKVEELNKRPDSKAADFIALAAAYGVTITEADFAAGKKPDNELTDDELEAIAGGQFCLCLAGGGGTAGESSYGRGRLDAVCACVLGGSGWSADKCYERCLCVLYGEGEESQNGKYYGGIEDFYTYN